MNTNYTNKFQRDMMANNIPLSSGEKQSPRSAGVWLNDLELSSEEFSIACYHQTGIRLIEKRPFWEAISEPKKPAEYESFFYQSLSKFKVIVKNITKSDDKNKFDNPLMWLRGFRKHNIDVTFLNSADIDVIRKVSPPLYEYITPRVVQAYASEREPAGEVIKETCIKFLDEIRDYEHESGKQICYDERTSEELYQIFIQDATTPPDAEGAEKVQYCKCKKYSGMNRNRKCFACKLEVK